MPPCYCNSHQCGGKEVDRRTLKTHLLDDQAVAARVVQKKATNIVNAYVEDIGIHLSELTLADEVSGGSTCGGRLWSRSTGVPADIEGIANVTADQDPGGVSNTPPCKSRRSSPKPKTRKEARVDRKFEELEAIDIQIRAFAREATEKVASLQPGAIERPEAFPLNNLRQKCRAFRQDLGLINASDHSVVAFKRSIEEDLKEVEESLGKAEKEWALSPRPAQGGGVYYDTSE